MNCDEIEMLLEASPDEADSAGRRRVAEHLATCGNCRDALRAIEYLHVERNLPVPPPSRGAFSRAMQAATVPRALRRHRPSEFWKGLAAGVVVAASIAAVAMTLILLRPSGDAPPEVTIAMHEPRDVSIAIEAPEALRNAEIHVRLRGAVGLMGFEGQRDIHWTTNLEQGLNELTLPVVATGEQGGQVQVVVHHGNKRKAFLVDVHTAQAG